MNRDSENYHNISFKTYDPGRYVRQGGYERFIPSPVNHRWTWTDARINTLLEDATRALIELDAFSRIVPNIDLFIRLHIVSRRI